MDSTLFYYLAGSVQHGPFTLTELKQFSLDGETFIWYDKLENWKKLKDCSIMVNSVIIPPPIPQENFSSPNKLDQSQKLLEINPNNKISNRLKTLTLAAFFFFILSLLVYMYLNNKKDTLKNECIIALESVFNGRSVIIDGENYRVSGTLTNEAAKIFKKKKTRTKIDTNKIDFDKVEFPDFPWWESKGIIKLFRSNLIGGFTVNKLTKTSETSFNIEVYDSRDMGYKTSTEPLYSVQEYYNKAFDFFTKDDNSHGYVPGKLNEIKNIANTGNEFYSMENIGANNSNTGTSWEPMDSYPGLEWPEAIVFYSLKGKHYEMVFNQENFYYTYAKIESILLGIMILTLGLLRIIQPNFFNYK